MDKNKPTIFEDILAKLGTFGNVMESFRDVMLNFREETNNRLNARVRESGTKGYQTFYGKQPKILTSNIITKEVDREV